MASRGRQKKAIRKKPKSDRGVGKRPLESGSITGPEVPSSGGVLAKHLGLNAEEHVRDCAKALLRWPTIADDARSFDPAIETQPFLVFSDSLVACGNTPFNSRALVHTTKAPVLSAEECKDIIQEAEDVGRVHGWEVMRQCILMYDGVFSNFVLFCSHATLCKAARMNCI